MEELINSVCQRTGLSPDKARSAVETVVEYLKGKLPSSVSSQLDSALSGESSGITGRIASAFGKKSA